MNHENGTIGPLMKVELDLLARPLESSGQAPEPVSMHFIYGIGVSGLTPFEKALAGKSSGEQLTLDVTAEHIGELFGHLGCTMIKTIAAQLPWRLEVRVKSAEKAGDRELIKAMAEMGGCEGDCGCGCG